MKLIMHSFIQHESEFANRKFNIFGVECVIIIKNGFFGLIIGWRLLQQNKIRNGPNSVCKLSIPIN